MHMEECDVKMSMNDIVILGSRHTQRVRQPSFILNIWKFMQTLSSLFHSTLLCEVGIIKF